jgi:putative glutamine amidotransferase
VKRIGLSLRRVEAAAYDETRDALARDWGRYFQGPLHGAVPCPILNAGLVVTHWAESLALDGLILTGGDDFGDDPLRDETEVALLAWAEFSAIPVLGICRGFQVMQQRLGGALEGVSGHVDNRHRVRMDGVLREVNSYHHMAVRRLAEGFIPLAIAEDDSIEAAYDERRRWLGVMWHPERGPAETSDTVRIRAHFDLPVSKEADA